MFKKLSTDILSNQISLVFGPCGSGKTFKIRQLFTNNKQLIYVDNPKLLKSFEIPRNVQFLVETDMEELFDHLLYLLQMNSIIIEISTELNKNLLKSKISEFNKLNQNIHFYYVDPPTINSVKKIFSIKTRNFHFAKLISKFPDFIENIGDKKCNETIHTTAQILYNKRENLSNLFGQYFSIDSHIVNPYLLNDNVYYFTENIQSLCHMKKTSSKFLISDYYSMVYDYMFFINVGHCRPSGFCPLKSFITKDLVVNMIKSNREIERENHQFIVDDLGDNWDI